MTDSPTLTAWIKELREGLTGLPDGPWDVEYGEIGKGPDVRGYALLRSVPDERYTGIETVEVHSIEGSRIMEHLARCSPDRIAALLDRVEAMAEALKEFVTINDTPAEGLIGISEKSARYVEAISHARALLKD